MKKIYLFGALFALLLLGATACKPTEKGYRMAYEAAKQKAHEGIDDETYEKMVEAAKPPMTEVDGVKMRRKTEYLSIAYPESEMPTPKRYSVAVGQYKMRINAKAHTDRLRTEGLPALMLQAPGDDLYVIIGTFDTESEAAAAASEYNRTHTGQFVSLDYPLLLISAR